MGGRGQAPHLSESRLVAVGVGRAQPHRPSQTEAAGGRMQKTRDLTCT